MAERTQALISIEKDPVESGRRLVVNMLKYTGFSSTQEKRHRSAMELLELVVNSREFRDKVRAITSFTSSSQNGVQVYNTIMTGQETLRPGVDYKIDLEVTLYESNNSTVGYTYPNSIGVWMNNKFFKQYSLGEIAGNAFHEWLHKIGYDHTSNATSARPNSVPYRLGYLMGDMVDQYLDGTLKLTDLYPITETTPAPGNPPVVVTNPTPVVVPPVEVVKVKKCAYTWRFWLGKMCWYE